MAAKKKASKKKAATRKKAAVKKKASPKKATTRKATAKKPAAKKATSRKKAPAKKKAAAPKKAAARKKSAKKATAKKASAKAPASKRPAAKSASVKRSGTRKIASPARRRTSSTPAEEPHEVPEAPARDEPEAVADAGASAEGRPTAGGLRRGRRRRLPARRTGAPKAIPPLPEEADDVSFDEADMPPPPPPRESRGRERDRDRDRDDRRRGARDRGDDPARLLARVRRRQAPISRLARLPLDTLHELASAEGIETSETEDAESLAHRVVKRERTPPEEVGVEGLLELHPDGYGFLRRAERSYAQHPEDVYVPAPLIQRLRLQAGHWVSGQASRPRAGQAYLALQGVEEVNHGDPARVAELTPFQSLTVVYPETRLVLEGATDGFEMRVMDLFCPLGRGQRGLIVAPPRTGKTVLMTKLADAIATNSPDVDIVVLLVDERPEEVTNMRRSVRGEVIASTFDKPSSNHVRVAELVVEKVKRMVELGRHVVLLLDSITRLGRAYNNQAGGSGRILTGGLDANALTKPKRFFGSARNVEDGGSLTIIATALIDTGSRLDQVIFEEFKGTGNMECVLSRDLSNARVWPAIDVPASGTRNEDLLLHPDELARVVMLRRGVTGQDPLVVMQTLTSKLKEFPTNGEFLLSLGGGGATDPIPAIDD